jgi:hypothetical protein
MQSSAATLALSTTTDFEAEGFSVHCQLLPHVVAMFQRAATDNFNSLRTTHEMGYVFVVLYNNGQWDQAALLQHQAFKLKRKLLSEEHISTLRSMGNMATALREQGRAAKAEALHWQENEIEQSLGRGAF